MQRLDLTLPTPAENLALDEALLDWAEEDGPDWEFVRTWESPQPIVVVGRSSRVSKEILLPACSERKIPVLRRSSGGAAIVAGPGCLMYAVVLSYRRRPELQDISRAHAFVLGRLAATLRPLLGAPGDFAHAGTSDLVIRQVLQRREDGVTPCSQLPAPGSIRKFSGNSLRAKRTHLLYHGTLLYDFDLSLVDVCLQMPPRQPEYRDGRSHSDFVANLPLGRDALVEAVAAAWPASGDLADWPRRRVAALVAERFGRDEWNYEFP
jgi:lipoate---protein ligase